VNTGTWTIKLLMAVIYGFLLQARVFVSGKPLQPSLMFAERLERLARDKHSSLLRKYVNYGRKKFYSTGLG
jgi:hypothetical protein